MVGSKPFSGKASGRGAEAVPLPLLDALLPSNGRFRLVVEGCGDIP